MSDDHVTLPDEPPDDAPGDGAAPAEAPTPDDGPTVCAECGSPLEENQQYCLECGAPTPFAVPLRKRGATGGVIAAALLALGIGGGALIYGLTRDDEPSATATVTGPVSTSITTLPPFTQTTLPTGTGFPNPFPTTTDTTDTLTDFTDTFTDTTGTFTDTTDTFTDTTDTFTDTTDTFTDTTDTFTDPGDDDWTGGDGYTVILRSATSRAVAEDFLETVQDSGRSAGILVSDNYSSLQPGFYVVFTGTYTTAAAARSAAAGLRATYPDAYAARVAV